MPGGWETGRVTPTPPLPIVAVVGPTAAGKSELALDLAEALGMTPVAEGVETEPQRAFLADHGCELAQGFHLARPLPPDEATALLERLRGEPGA